MSKRILVQKSMIALIRDISRLSCILRCASKSFKVFNQRSQKCLFVICYADILKFGFEIMWNNFYVACGFI